MAFNPAAIPFQPQAHEIYQACYHVSGRVPIDIFGHDWNISKILLDSGASANFISDNAADKLELPRDTCPAIGFTIMTGEIMKLTSFVTFPLYIGGVFQGSIKAYVKPAKDGEMHVVLGMPGWDAFLIGIERTSELVRETIATVAQHVEGGPEERYVVPDVGNVAMEISMVSSIPLGARALGETLEARRHRKHMVFAGTSSQFVQTYAQHDAARAQTIVDELMNASSEMRDITVEKRHNAMRFLKSLEGANQFIRDAGGQCEPHSDIVWPFRNGEEYNPRLIQKMKLPFLMTTSENYNGIANYFQVQPTELTKARKTIEMITIGLWKGAKRVKILCAAGEVLGKIPRVVFYHYEANLPLSSCRNIEMGDIKRQRRLKCIDTAESRVDKL